MMTSSENTRRGSKESERDKQPAVDPSAAAVLDVADDEDPKDGQKDTAKASLEEQLQQERDGRTEERFCWIVVVVILVDVLWFRNAPNAVVPIVVLLLQAVILFILAKRMGIEEISQLFERLIHGVTRTGQQ